MRPLRVAIVGARGIGRHHARWFHLAGGEVSALYGTTEASAQQAAEGLRQSFGFRGRAFHQWDRFLAEGDFDAAVVASPAERHHSQVLDLAKTGKHLLCEKPLTWEWGHSAERMAAEGREMVEACSRAGVIFGMNAQYPAAVPGFAELYRRRTGEAPEFSDLRFVMATRNPPRSAHGAAEVWVDLGPHPLAFLDAVAPGQIDLSTLRHRDGELDVTLQFDWLSGERRVAVTIECRRIPAGEMRRTIQSGSVEALYEGYREGDLFRTRLRSGEEVWTGPDLMQLSVERFVEAVKTGEPDRVLVGPEAALRQHTALAQVWRECWRR